ncbi:MAG TPA: outer-membrane lipoprotein carrier protein LolA [Rhizomicrobium sp.]|nr:outer-membrane lipoprotein carrier protein LolA [Rhizomicrobium sp.]
MRRILILCLGMLAVAVAAVADPVGRAQFTPSQRADLARINTYLNSIRTMTGGFSQIDPNGDVDIGTFAIAKPGKMRFEYKPPTPTLIVSDGKTVAIRNSRLRTLDTYSLSDTPLDIILGDKIDLLNDHSITGIERQQDALIVHARSRGSNAQGNISLVFALPNLELRQWTVVDNQGLQTTVALRDVQIGADVSHVSFALPPKYPSQH